MADAAPVKSLGDFFAKKKTKKIKALNLNTQPVIEKKEGDAAGADKAKKKEQDKEKKEGDWVEKEEEAQAGPKSALGQLERDYEEEEQAKPAPKAWGAAPTAEKGMGKGKGSASRFQNKNLFPTLQASTTGVPIGAHREETVLVSTKKKNLFAGLADSDDDDDKPKNRQGLARKKQGEADVALGKSPRGELTREEQERRDEKNRKNEEKKEKKKELQAQRAEEEKDDEVEEEVEAAADTLIVMDTEGAQNKFVGKRKLPKTQLPASELKEQAKQVVKKKMKFKQPEEKKKVIMEIDAKDDAW